MKQGSYAELVSASSAHVVLKDKLQAWKISNQAHNDNTNFTSGLHPTYNNTNAWGRSDVSPTIASVRQRGFTLIELLVVVLIIGILAAVALPQYQKAVDKARFVQTKVTMQEVFRAQQLFFLANGRYAVNWDELNADLPPVTSGGGTSHYAYWDWGYCYLYEKYGGCAIKFKDGDIARLVRYWNSPNASCSYAGEGRGKKLCHSFQQ